MRTCKRGHKYEAVRDEKGHLKECKECRAFISAEYHKKRKLTEGFLQKHAEISATWRKNNKHKEEYKLAMRASRLKSRYWPHLTAMQALMEYEKLLVAQEYRCRICEVDQKEYEENFHVDHCHTTNKVRGLLCAVCNRYVVGGIDTRAKAKKVRINKHTLLANIVKYFEELDPEYQKWDKFIKETNEKV